MSFLIICDRATVDYKKDKRIREREKARVTQLYETVPQEAIDDSALIVENDPYCQIRHNSKFGPTLQLPQYRASIGPGEENKFDALNVQSRNFRRLDFNRKKSYKYVRMG